MRYRVATGLLFAILMFSIPLLALFGTNSDVQLLPIPNVPVQEIENQTADTPLQKPPQAPAEDLQVYPEKNAGFDIYDQTSEKVFHVDNITFVRGAVAAEMPPTFHKEALKAQAVAAHTYALVQKANHEQEPDKTIKEADFSADPENWKVYTTEEIFKERYGELGDAYWKMICEAADEAAGYILTYEDEPIVAAYHSMSSGTTEDASNVWTGSAPYLVPVESYGDTLAPDYESAAVFSVQQVQQVLTDAYPKIQLPQDPAQWFEIVQRSEGGYVTKMYAGDVELAGKDLRTLLQLRSADFTISCDGSQFTFNVKGYGHGVGLSQYGADYMARQGSSFDEILLHYYTGAALTALVN
ncbi:stage II sporulation protein D [Youxingia wuxianensis]|uniref:Stage II sporulation protein D n=1 Tax=Youxingia wuxianensis TaxID=2763678 RepID=A0A926EMW8_9FIRM|nr:stage II sporulation protein D [Youxingia wuxianensis]MBC8585536.1 stage II sporulation protein D [Youxingia wuxianensis]